MEIVEDTLDDREPRVSSLWFLWEGEAIWTIAGTEKTYPERVKRTLAVVDSDATTGKVQHTGARDRRSPISRTPRAGPDAHGAPPDFCPRSPNAAT